jgi:hypothetical protein
MKAILRYFMSPDRDLQNYRPIDPEDDGFLLQFFIGPADGPGEESFDVVVCTPRWLTRQVDRVGVLSGRHHLIMDRIDVAVFQEFIRTAVEAVDEGTWEEVALRIGRIGRWEFEDYRP